MSTTWTFARGEIVQKSLLFAVRASNGTCLRTVSSSGYVVRRVNSRQCVPLLHGVDNILLYLQDSDIARAIFKCVLTACLHQPFALLSVVRCCRRILSAPLTRNAKTNRRGTIGLAICSKDLSEGIRIFHVLISRLATRDLDIVVFFVRGSHRARSRAA